MPDGQYTLGANQVFVKDGEARLAQGNLAGSTLTMDRAVRNMAGPAGAGLARALRMATRNPADSLGFVLIYVFVAAVAASLVNPRKDALLQLNINPQERARLNALIMASTIALSSPFGYLAGWLSSLDRRLPFVFSFVLFLVAMLVISRIQEPSMEEETA